MKRLEVLEFIKNTPNWREELEKRKVTIREDEELITLSYGKSCFNFSEKMIKECRGLVIDKEYNVASMKFEKFFNISEPEAVEDMVKLGQCDNLRFLEKIDGSIIGVFKHKDKWYIGTNNVYDSHNANCLYMDEEIPFFNIFEEVLEKVHGLGVNHFFSKLNPKYTYVYELASHKNKVIVDYPTDDIYVLTVVDKETLQEVPNYEQLPELKLFKFPKVYDFKTFGECFDYFKSLDDFNFEGFVVSGVMPDGDTVRVKIKNPKYLEISKEYKINKTSKYYFVKLFHNDLERNIKTEMMLAEKNKYLEAISKLNDILKEFVRSTEISTVGNKKEYAIRIKDRADIDPYFKSKLFEMTDGFLKNKIIECNFTYFPEMHFRKLMELMAFYNI